MASASSSLLPILLLLSLSCLTRSLAQAVVKGKAVQCPGNPKDLCNFYFYKFEYSIPTFNLTLARNDKPFSTPVMAYPDRTVQVQANVGQEVFLTPFPAGGFIFPNGTSRVVRNVFTLLSFPSKLSARNVKNYKPYLVNGPCIYLHFKGASLWKNHELSQNLADGKDDPTYPINRRCIVFKTTY